MYCGTSQIPTESSGQRIRRAATLYSCVASLILLALAACVTPLPNVVTAIPGQSIAFGKIDVLENGQPPKWTTGEFAFIEITSGRFRILLIQEATSKLIHHDLENDGSVHWSLAPGKYLVAGFDWTDGSRNTSGQIRAHFTIPDGVPAVYFGTLALSLSSGRYGIEIRDEFDDAAAALAEKMSGFAGTPIKNLMELEEEPTGGSRYTAHVCNKVWEVACGERYRGVTPLDPVVGQLSDVIGHLTFPNVDNLHPTLKWSASDKAGVGYDVILYEAIQYETANGRVALLRGSIADYAENLRDAEYRPTNPLKPGTRYLWSVRLRKDDKISTWSTYRYDHFFVLGFSRANNLFFSFKTPDK